MNKKSRFGVIAAFSGFLCALAVLSLFTGLGNAQGQSASATPDAADASASPASPEIISTAAPSDINSRIFGVLPNYRTADGNVAFSPLTPKLKIKIALEDSTDWPIYPTTGFFALLYQAENQNPTFGQGVKGYSKRFAAAYGDLAIGNMLTEGFLPAAFHQDPRYFRSGQGSVLGRTFGALKQMVVAKSDTGRPTFNAAEFGGDAAAAVIGNLYYPDARKLSDNLSRFYVQVLTDATSDVLKEFWPDIKRRFFVRHNPS